MEREVQRVVEIMVEVRAGRDHEVDQAAVHQFDDAATEPGGRHRPCDGQPDGGVVLAGQHLLGENRARFRQAPGVECLESVVDQMANLGAAGRPVVTNRLAGQHLFLGLPGRAGRAVRHESISFREIA
jgi:hypothetical protein